MPLSIFGICPPRSSTHPQVLPGRNVHRALLDVHPDPELAECRDDRDEVVGLDVLDRDVAARKSGQGRKACDLDVLGPDPVLSAAE